jgi:hypothetical protein
LGNYRDKNINFWKKDGDKISNIWSVKNPYSDLPEDHLTTVEIEYLKQMLFQINKYRLGIKDSDSVDVTSLETLGRTAGGQKILNSINEGTYFRMPLIRSRQQLSRVGSSVKNVFGNPKERTKQFYEELRSAVDSRELDPEDRNAYEKLQSGFYNMIDIYDSQTPAFKKEMIDKNTSDYYEISLDVIANQVAFSKIRQHHMNLILPIINSYMW